MVKDLQENLMFLLVLCYKPKCVRPVRPEKEETCFDSSHPVDVVSLAIPDPKTCWSMPKMQAKLYRPLFVT